MAINILVVDDEPDLQVLLRQKFKQQTKSGAWQLVFAEDGVEALEMLEADPSIDMVLTDINMPRMDGLTLLSHIQSMDRPIRTVIISAYSDMSNIRTAMNRGAYDFVTKPIDMEDLETTIEKTWEEIQTHKKALEAQYQLEVTQKELEVSQELQALKARFFADLSHEFRTPLTLILGPIQDALRGAYGTAGRLPSNYLSVMEKHALRLKTLIDQLLDLSKLEAGRMTLRASRHDVITFLEHLVQAFAPAAERKHLDLHFAPPDEPDRLPLYFEPDKLEKIVGNLLSNALKFTPEQGTIRVSVKPSGDDHVDITVRDSGPGIPKDQLPYLFDRFHQIDDATAHAHEGTGIGLSLTKELVELHGGEIAVESEPGFGATFTVRLPRGKEHLHPSDLAEATEETTPTEPTPTDEWAFGAPDDEESALSSSEDTRPHAPRPTVLVVDDNADVRAYLKHHLGRQYSVVEAEDGSEGLERARAESPALIISDVMMPGMSGYELCRTLKADDALSPIPIILLTAKASEESKVEGLEIGADEYLYKPFNAEELMLRVENLIEVRRLLRERFTDEVVLQPADVTVPSAEAAFLQRVQTFVEEHMDDPDMGVAEVADAVGLSPRQLRRKIRDLTRLSPSGFIRTLRLQRAAQLLEQRAGTVSQIAYEVGFNDPKYFSQLFRQVYGVVPSEYSG